MSTETGFHISMCKLICIHVNCIARSPSCTQLTRKCFDYLHVKYKHHNLKCMHVLYLHLNYNLDVKPFTWRKQYIHWIIYLTFSEARKIMKVEVNSSFWQISVFFTALMLYTFALKSAHRTHLSKTFNIYPPTL